MQKYLLVFVSFFILSCSKKTGVTFNDQRIETIDSLITHCSSYNSFTGYILVAEKGKTLYQKEIGMADIQKNMSIDSLSLFYSASVAKTITSTAVLKLISQGKLSLEDSVRKWFPELPFPNVKIKNLLSHTSGIPDYIGEYWQYWGRLRLNDPEQMKISSNDDAIKLLVSNRVKPNFKPGEKFEYSNSNYILLATIVQKVSGIPFGEFLQQNIFAPAGMTHTFVFPNKKIDEHRAFGYHYFYLNREPELRDLGIINGVAGDGGLYLTAQDLLKFDQALYTNKIVPQSLLDQAYTPYEKQLNIYGFGWIVPPDTTRKIVAHGGNWGGFNNCFQRDLTNQRTIIILSNNECPPLYLVEILNAIDHVLAGKSFRMPGIPAGKLIALEYKKKGIDAALQLGDQMLNTEYKTPDSYSGPALLEFSEELGKANKKEDSVKINVLASKFLSPGSQTK